MHRTLEDQLSEILDRADLSASDRALLLDLLLRLIAARESEASASAQQLLAEFRINLEQLLHPAGRLTEMSVRQLRQVASQRGLSYRGLTREELLLRLSSPKPAQN